MKPMRRTPRRRSGAAALAAGLTVCVAMGGCGSSDTPTGSASPPRTGPATTAGASGGSTSPSTATAPSPATPTTSPPAAGFHSECLTAAEAARAVRLRSAGGTLAGVELGTGTRALLLTHQTGGSLCDWWPFARTLGQQGYRVLAVDLDYSARSSAGKPTHDADVVTAVRHLRATGARRVAVVGLSLGGTVAVVAAAQIQPRLAAVASISGPADYFDIDALPAAKRTTVPVLAVIAATDPTVDVEGVKALAAAVRAPGSKLVLVPGSSHGRELLEGSTRDARVVTELTRFLATTLGRA